MDGMNSGVLDRLDQLLREFSAMQSEHAALFGSGRLSEVACWRQKRQSLSLAIKSCFEQLEKEQGVRKDHPLRGRIKAHVKEIMLSDKLLQEQVAAQQTLIKDQLAALRKGKQAVNGYSIRGAPAPRFLSSRG